MDDKLRLTLKKIEALAKKNPEFALELQKITKRSSPANPALYSDDKISKIEQYLGLDYELDSYSPELDYNKISHGYVRTKLISDYREMLRYRYGVRSHKIDFSEFCKYAHFQAEMLINYYLYEKYNDFESFKTAIKEKTPKTRISDNISTIEGVSYSSKIYFIKQISNFKDYAYILEFICWVRNNVNHRAPNNDQDLGNKHSDYLNLIKNSGLPLNENRDEFNWHVIYNDTVKKNIFETKYKYQSPYKEGEKAYKYDKFMLSEQFNDVIKVLKELFNEIQAQSGK
ncbi:MAG: hypothetical protein R3Y22_03925 [Bacteroidales bacterium]